MTGGTPRHWPATVHPPQSGPDRWTPGAALTGRAGEPPHPPPRSWPGPAGGGRRDDVCGRCDALRTSCYCFADVDALRLFARRMAEIHERTGTRVCGCGAHSCYVRKRLDDIDRTDRP